MDKSQEQNLFRKVVSIRRWEISIFTVVSLLAGAIWYQAEHVTAFAQLKEQVGEMKAEQKEQVAKLEQSQKESRAEHRKSMREIADALVDIRLMLEKRILPLETKAKRGRKQQGAKE